jgi:hypothetical protein
MREIEAISVFTGKDVFSLDLTDYEKILDETIEYENSIDLRICFYKDNKVVRELWNPSCDIRYKD